MIHLLLPFILERNKNKISAFINFIRLYKDLDICDPFKPFFENFSYTLLGDRFFAGNKFFKIIYDSIHFLIVIQNVLSMLLYKWFMVMKNANMNGFFTVLPEIATFVAHNLAILMKYGTCLYLQLQKTRKVCKSTHM